MGGTCSMHGRDEKVMQFWLENLKGRDHSEDLGIDRWEAIRMGVMEIGLGGLDWMHLAQWQALVTSRATVSFSRFLLHIVS